MAKRVNKKPQETVKGKAGAKAGTDAGSKTGARKIRARTASRDGGFNASDKKRPRRVVKKRPSGKKKG
jgi:hypothetical protein